ncbi:hypothetical protein T459_34038 [Capsicum annuum]|uniref:Glycine-rich RNA-binding protein 1-3 n=1 Tax=Capsicum annuum TaxID=4072 RepID=A0A097KV29_CAPAN|nr:glycine-rich RNA-binding protein 1-3 [Capsicum annuum]AIT97258.1 glycine-rich RNA-binding protein 1-3 [Capsicum annuum]PHT62114.1 hypothetical protein T459_34038 [Capsicum annuum]
MAEVEYRCFVGGLAWATNDQTLADAFSQFGEVTESKVCCCAAGQRSDPSQLWLRRLSVTD